MAILFAVMPLQNRKIRSRYIICTQSALIRCKDCENWSSRCRDIRHWISKVPFRFWMPERRNWGVCHFFTKSVSMATSLEISKKRGPDRSSAPKTLLFGEKITKIGGVDPEIICLREIIKKEEKLENAWQSLAYSPLGAVVSPPSQHLWKHLLTDHLSA